MSQTQYLTANQAPCRECGKPINKTKIAVRCKSCAEVVGKMQRSATAKIRRQIKLGRMTAALGQRCSDCGGVATEYDHRDYRKPLVVEPVCRACNYRRGPAVSGILKVTIEDQP